MKSFITVQIIRPSFEFLDAESRNALIKEMAENIAEQIVTQEELKHRQEDIIYWQNKILDWQIEDHLNEIKYGKLRSDHQEP